MCNLLWPVVMFGLIQVNLMYPLKGEVLANIIKKAIGLLIT
jgi:hypothetical protein